MSQETIGQRLSDAREAIQASLYRASQDTKIRIDFLESLEADDFNFVSGSLYVRGMLRSYLRWLGLEEAPLLQEYDRLHQARAEAPLAEMISRPADVGPRPRRPQWLIAAVGAAGILLVLSLVGLMNPSNVAAPPAAPRESQARVPSASSPATAPAVPPAMAAQTPVAGVSLKVDVVGDKAWMQASADGNDAQPLYSGTLSSGQSRTFEAKDYVKLLIGNLGGVRLTFNGQDLGVPGQPGQVGTLRFPPDTLPARG